MMKPLLAISGRRFSGKDTLAALLVAKASERGLKVSQHAFAAESSRMFVEREAARGVVVDLERLQNDREYKESRRPQLTAFTVESLAADPLVFSRSVADRIERESQPSLVMDVRLRLEVEYLRRRFALHLVRLERSDEARAASGWTYAPSIDDQRTETELDEQSLWDEVLTNDGTIGELGVKAVALIESRLPSQRKR